MEAEVRPTEDLEKVRKAVLSVIKPDEITVEELGMGFRIIRATSSRIESLEPLKNMAKVQQVEPALRSYLLKHRYGNTISILLHKQAAYVGKLSLIDSNRESPLGPIRVEIEGSEEELARVVEYLTKEE